MSRLPLFLVTTATSLVLLLPCAGAAEPPPLLDYQGVLRDADDEPLDGSYDMVFRFFDAEVGGSEILVDSHVGPDQVTVDGGLFATTLGGGSVADGAAALPNDPYTSLAQVFKDFSEVWLEIQIEGETLAPRTRVLASAYALNAAHLDGFEAGNFLDTSANPQSKLGSLTIGGVDVEGDVRLVDEFFQSIYFSDGGDPQAQALRWDGADGVFEATAGMQFEDALAVGDTVTLPTVYNRFASAGENPSGAGFDDAGDVYLSGSLEADGSAYFSGEIFVDNDGPDGDQHVWFFNDGSPIEELKWDETAERFEFSDALAIVGSLRTGQTQAAPEAFNHLGDLGKEADSDDMSGPQDLYVEGDVEIEERLYLGGELVMLDFGPDADGDGNAGDDVDQWIFFYDDETMDDEWLTWENDASGSGGGDVDRFEFSDSLHVYGDLTALNKNFVQNHPHRDDLEIVYTSLEGDEATVFTRGHARLVDGEATVPLGETFHLVANPELGLSAHLTPRGSAAQLYVASLTPERLVVQSEGPAGADVAFDYVVFGLRLGYEDQPVLRSRRGAAPLPPPGYWEDVFARTPDARALSASMRYEAMSAAAFGRTADADGPRARALRAAIGEGDPQEPRRGATGLSGGDRSESVRPGDTTSREGTTGSRLPPAAASASAAPDVAAGAGFAPGAFEMRARTFSAEGAGVGGLYPGQADIVPGDVVALDPNRPGAMRRAATAEDPTVIGVASADPGVVLASKGANDEVARVTVALSGIVPCKVDASYGSILPGDLLVTSPTPGHAMRRDDPLPGTVIGKALQALSDGAGTIPVLVFQR